MKQREIKYEAWDGRGTMFVQVLDEVTDYGYVFVARDDLGKPPSEQVWYPFGIIMADPKWIKRQWTGLVDKCGKEIFEGDVVTMEGNPDPSAGDPVRLCVVEYHGPSLMYVDLHRSNEDSVESIIGVCSQDDGAEIIGNVFENPELISE